MGTLLLIDGELDPATIGYQATNTSGTINPPQGTLNWNSAGIGTADADRRVFVVLVGDTHPLSSATIGGIAADQIDTIVGSFGITVFSAPVPTGTTANIVMNFTVGVSAQNFRAFTVPAVGIVSATPQDVWSNTGTTSPAAGSVNCDEGGVLIGGFLANASSQSFSGLQSQIFADSPRRSVVWEEVAADGAQNFSSTLGSVFFWQGKVLSFR